MTLFSKVIQEQTHILLTSQRLNPNCLIDLSLDSKSKVRGPSNKKKKKAKKKKQIYL